MTAEASFLFVHGGSHGAWCWNDTIGLLTDDGRKGHAFDLPGAGEDPTPRGGITLADYVDATIAAIDAIPSGEIILVGHSIAGMTLPEVAHRRKDRVACVVFLAALTLRRGERGIDEIPLQRRPGYFEMASASPDNTLALDFESAWRRFFNHLDEAAARAAFSRLTPQPLGPYLDPVTVGVDDMAVPCRYLMMTDDRTFPPGTARHLARKAGVKPEELAGDHCVMLSDPQALVACLLRS